jgi:hypothetical protein
VGAEQEFCQASRVQPANESQHDIGRHLGGDGHRAQGAQNAGHEQLADGNDPHRQGQPPREEPHSRHEGDQAQRAHGNLDRGGHIADEDQDQRQDASRRDRQFLGARGQCVGPEHDPGEDRRWHWSSHSKLTRPAAPVFRMPYGDP